eukprot:TRINITY_DN40_c0_g4_i1.p1 TRINITY_DN40_c0_g4~~TRINITY_DN40_c0_g4_i1.p1  ORF type:complete len:457 (+),score=117.83 TRINITY_DN40_c0_g4_i1:149-1372(+)
MPTAMQAQVQFAQPAALLSPPLSPLSPVFNSPLVDSRGDVMQQGLLVESTATAEAGLVPSDFRAQCDAVFAALPGYERDELVGGRAPAASARACWDQYNLNAGEVEAVCSACFGAKKTLLPQQFALGSFLLASKQQNSPLPEFLPQNQYVLSSFADARKARKFEQSRLRNGILVKAMLWANLLIGLVSCGFWFLELFSGFTLLFALYFFYISRIYPFLCRNKRVARAVLGLGITGGLTSLGGFIFGSIFVHDAWLWGITCAGWVVPQLTYVVLSTIAIARMDAVLTKYRKEGLIELPPLVSLYANSRSLFITGWVFVGTFSTASIVMCFVCIPIPALGIATGIYMWSGQSVGSIIGIGMFSELIRRRYRTGVSVVGLVAALLMVALEVAAGVPVFARGVRWQQAYHY